MRAIRTLALAAVAAAVLLGGCKKSDKEGTKPATAGHGKATAGGGSAATAPEAKPEAKAPEGCNSDFSQPIQANYTLTKKCSPYTLASELSVDGWDLTIEPGVELRFGEGASLSVGYNAGAKLLARGTADEPIRFVSSGRKEAGAWTSVGLYSNARGSELANVVIEHAGRDEKPAVRVEAEDVKLTGLKVVEAKGRAVEVTDADKASVTAFSNNDFTQAGKMEAIVLLNLRSLPGVTADNKFAKGGVIELAGTTHENLTIKDPGVPYRLKQSLDIDGKAEDSAANLGIEPGVVIQMGEDTQINLGYNAAMSLKAVGTAEKPIVFTRFGTDVTNGSWKGINFYGGAKPPVLDYVRIEYAGTPEHPAVRYEAAKGLGKVTHCTIAHSAGNGLQAESDVKARFQAFSDNTFEDIAGAALKLPAELADGLGANNKYPPNARLELSGDIHQDTTLTTQEAAYVVEGPITVDGDNNKTTTLTIEPGAKVRFVDGAKLFFGYNGPGQLKIEAPADKPVVFTAHTEKWDGLEFGDQGKAAFANLVVEKLNEERPAVMFHEGASGSAKGLTVKDAKRAVQNCAAKVTVSGVKGDGAKGNMKEGC